MQQITASSVGIALFVLTLCATAQSTEADPAVIFQQAVDAYDNEDYILASSLFRQANAISFNWKLLYNIGQSEAAAKRNGLALQAFEEYLTRAGDDITLERREEVVREIQRLKLIVGMLEVDAPAGAIVMVDGEMRDKVPLMGPIMISAGIAHNVTIVFDDQQILQQNIRVSGGNTLTLKATPLATSQPPEETAQTDDNTQSTTKTDSESDAVAQNHRAATKTRKPLGPILMATGVTILGTGLALGGIAYKNGTDLDDRYPNGVPGTKSDDVDRVNTLALTADILIPVGAAVAVSGFVVWMIQRKKANKSEAVAPTAFVGPDVLGISLAGRF
ncbi:MAG: hypothetical protein JXX14_26380 [Deltaproteobacteria bacterium]|nr:hypothetical protein [Deltaproteobacteria bacterium]